MDFRIETDSMGEVKVPASAYYGAQTQRAVDNFNISDLVMPIEVVRALALVKWAAAKSQRLPWAARREARRGDQLTPPSRSPKGNLKEHFPVDVFQTGSGTSTNMNANEVIANRANETLGGEIGAKKPVHPNDHVNMGQSSNDVIPTAIHVAAVDRIKEAHPRPRERSRGSLDQKAEEFDDVVKIGRTHLQDATPIRLGPGVLGLRPAGASSASSG